MADQLPRYAAVPLQRFVDNWQSDFRLLHLCMRGIGVLKGVPDLFEILIEDCEPEEHKKLASDLSEARKEAELAEKERETGFPLLHAHALVGMWGALQAAIEDMLVGILLNEPELLKKKCFAKIKLPLAEFETKDKDERMRFLLAELARNLGPKNGAAMFEGLLQHFDLAGKVADEDRKMLWQAHHLRNVLVHRASLADRRLVQACPWLKLQVNEPVTISHEMLGHCGGAVCHYVLALARRLAKRYNFTIPAPPATVLAAGDPQPSSSTDAAESPTE